MAGTEITSTPGVQGGFPCVAGTRTPVRSIVVAYFEHYGEQIEPLLEAFPHLTREQIEAALAFYRDNPQRVDDDIRRHKAAILLS